MNAAQKKILQLESAIHALEELLAVSESSFLKESKELEAANEQLVRENTYKAFFYASPEAMLTLYDNRFIDCNESAVKMLKAKNKDEVLNTHPWDLSPEYQPDGRLSSEKAEEMIATALKNGAYSFEWYHKRVNGEIFPVEVLLTAITIEGKQMFNSTWRELTEKKRAEKELNEYHQHLEELVKAKTREISIELEKHKQLESDIEQILEASSDAIRVIDKDYNIIYTSKSFNLLYGHPEDIIGKKCYEAVPEDECFTNSCPLKLILKDRKKFSTERTFKKKDGTEILYKIDIIPYNDSNGNFLGIIKNYQDITEEREAEKRLAEEIREREKLAERYRIIFEASGDMIVMFNKEGFLDCNKTAVKLLGYASKKELLEKTPVDITTAKQANGEDSISAVRRHNATTMREGTDCFEWICRRKDGTTFPVEVMLSRMEYQGRPAMLSVVRDITERKEAEERLAEEIREREALAEKYRILFESSGDAIAMFDEKGFFDCNKKTLELLGYASREELVGKTPIDITTSEQADGKKTLAAYEEHIKTAGSQGTDCFEWFCVRKDGTVFPTEVMLSRMEYQGRTVMLSIVRDITERKEAEAKLAELSEEYRLLFESSADAIVLHDQEKLIDCNKACLELFGFSSKKEFAKISTVQLSPPKQPDGQDSSTGIIAHMDKACREGRDFFEWIHLRKNGTAFPAEVLLNRMEYQGNMVLQSIIRDITERKEAEKKLAEEIREREKLAERYRILFETSADAITLFNKKSFFDCNKATLRLFGFSAKKDFIKVHPADISVPEQPDGRDSFTAANEHIGKAFREGTDFFEWVHKRQDGTPFPAEVLLSRMEYQGDLVIQAVVRDISERKEAQRIAEENAQQQGRIEMANNMLHDIGNAMTGISTYVLKPQMEKVWREIKSLYQLRDLFTGSEDKLIQVFGKEKQRALDNFMKALIASFEDRRARELELSGKISSAVGHVCSVIDLQRHYLKESASPLATKINLATIISDTLVMLSGNLKKKDIEVSFNVEDKELNISGDQTRLMRVFLNIIKNACEAFDAKGAAKTGRRLQIVLTRNKDKEEIKVVFADNGIGFAAGSGNEFFERGFTSKANGSGIGLHECRSIIESHGGTMNMESEGPNTGASIIITFPYVSSLHTGGSK